MARPRLGEEERRTRTVMVIQRNIKISIDRHREKGGRLSYPKLPVFPLFHPVSSGAETTVARHVEQVIKRDPFRYSYLRETLESPRPFSSPR